MKAKNSHKVCIMTGKTQTIECPFTKEMSRLKDAGRLDNLSGGQLVTLIKELSLCDMPLSELENSISELQQHNLLQQLDISEIEEVIKHLGLRALPALGSAGLVQKFTSNGILGHTVGIPNLVRIIEYFGLENEKVAKTIKLFLESGVGIRTMTYIGQHHPQISLLHKDVLSFKNPSGFSMAYSLLLSSIPLKIKIALEKTIDLNSTMPKGLGAITESPYHYYYHIDDSDTGKIAVVLYGYDQSTILEDSRLPHILLKKGYNVLVIDGRVGIEEIYETPSIFLTKFVAQNKIPMSTQCCCLFINAIGAVNSSGKHEIIVPDMFDEKIMVPDDMLDQKTMAPDMFDEKIVVPDMFDEKIMVPDMLDELMWPLGLIWPPMATAMTTDQLIKHFISEFSIHRPLDIFIDSCQGWKAINDMMPYLPTGSQVVSPGKYTDAEEYSLQDLFWLVYTDLIMAHAKEVDLKLIVISREVLRPTLSYNNLTFPTAGYAIKKDGNTYLSMSCEEEKKKVIETCYSSEVINFFFDWFCKNSSVCAGPRFNKLHLNELRKLGQEYHTSHDVLKETPLEEPVFNAFGCYISFLEQDPTMLT